MRTMPSRRAFLVGAALLATLALEAAAEEPQKARSTAPREGIEALRKRVEVTEY
jgi:hypothetical protein